jgi:hypothetical protein
MALTCSNAGSGADTFRLERSASVINANAAYCIMGWTKRTADPNNYSHMFHLGGTFSYDGVTDSIGSDSDGTTRRVSCAGGSATQTPTNGSWTVDTWTHVAMVRESTTSLKIYVDGAAVAALACTADVSGRTATSLMTAMNYNQFGQAGKMADVKAWATSLTAEEVVAEMNSKTTVKSSPWGYWPMDDTGSVANCLVDSSGNSRNWSQAGATGNVLSVDSDYPTFEPPTTQTHFRWRADDGDEDGATWLASEDANITRAKLTNTRLRVLVDTTTGDLSSSQFQLEWKKTTDSSYTKLDKDSGESLAFGAIGTVTTTGTTAPTVAYPSGITAGQLLVMVVGNRPNASTVDLPSGWTAGTTFVGGAGSEGADTGDVRITTFTRIADGTETGNVTLAISSGASCGAAIFRCTKAATGKTWAIAYATGEDASAGTSISVAFGTDPGVTAGDLVFVGFINSVDTAAHASEAITQTGITYGTLTERADTAVSTGNDLRVVICEHAVTSGTSSAVATWTATASGTNSASSAGPAIMIRLRQVDQAFLLTTSSNITASGENTTAQLTPPGGKSTSDFDAGRMQDDENPADAVDISADDYTELEWCMQARSTALDGDYTFRVTRAGAVLSTYSVTPQWTISAVTGGAAVGHYLRSMSGGYF